MIYELTTYEALSQTAQIQSLQCAAAAVTQDHAVQESIQGEAKQFARIVG